MAGRLLIFLTTLLLFFSKARSQDFIFNRLSMLDGLLSNNILSIWQDSTGYLWLGSEAGLQRYDGNAFRTILETRVDQIIADAQHRVWIRSGKRVALFDKNNFALKDIPYENNIQPFDVSACLLRKDASGKMLFIIKGSHCQYFDEQTKTFHRKFNPFVLPDSVRIIDVVEDQLQQRYWIPAWNGLGYWDKKTRRYYTAANNTQADPLLASRQLPPLVSHFFIDSANRYWIQAWDKADIRFFCFDANKRRFTGDTAGLALAGNGSYFEVYGFNQLADTVMAVYGLNCLRIREGQFFREIRSPANNPYGIHFNAVSAILKDKEGILWFATDNGLYHTPGNRFDNTHLIFSQEKARASVNCLMEDEQERLWIGTWGRGVFVMNNKRGAAPGIAPLSPLPAGDGFTHLVWSICRQPNTSKVWIGCQEGRLMVHDTEQKTTKLYRPAAFNNSTVRHIVADIDGSLWFGLQNGDLVQCIAPDEPMKASSFRRVHAFNGFITTIRSIDGYRLWIAVHGKGLYLFDTQTAQILRTIDGNQTQTTPIAAIKDIVYLTDTTCLLAGDQLGILNLKTSRVVFYSSFDQLAIGNTFTLQRDANGECWIGGSKGIFKFQPQTRSLTRYSQRDGLITIHNNSYIPETSLRLKDGRMAFAGNQFLVVFHPDQYKTSEAPPAVTITGVQLNNRYLPADSLAQVKTIRIPYAHSSISIEFAAISFLQHDKLGYEYKLEGLEDNWTLTKTAAPVRYQVLPPGHYRFVVRVKNEKGQYSPINESIALYIVPPFWKTPWFYVVIFLLVLGILYFLHRLRLKRLIHVERVRSRLARDLHDDMGSTLSTINILSNIALQQEPLDDKSGKEYMSTINASTNQMMDAMDDIVWSINPVNDHISKVLARMKEIAGAMLEPRQVEYRFEVEDAIPDLPISMESRREIFLIYKEALNNIIKYANCRNVQISLQKKDGRLLLTIADDGRGFDIKERKSGVRGNGLKNMQKRAENLRGSLVIASQPGQGTTITLSMPLK